MNPMLVHSRWAEFGIDSGINLLIGTVVVLFGVRPVASILRFASSAPPAEQARAADRLKGGAWIGALERLATFLCLIGHFMGGLPIVVAIKGLARFPDLKGQEPGVSERFIIGTFLSILLAIAGGAVALWLASLT